MWQSQVARRQLSAPPLRQQVFSCNPNADLAATVTARDCYKDYDKKNMTYTIQAVVDDGMSIRRAALSYNVPRSTLGDLISGHVLLGSTSGPPKLLR